MARRLRVEVEGGLYHLITRGNDRQDIFHCEDDHRKFLSLLATQKERSPFYLYAYCLMTNHVHLLIERRDVTVGRVMQRLLTGYSQYYNRRHRHIGHVFQGRHKAILCQTDGYLAGLVRYIHRNPVRAGMVAAAGDYPYSSHRAYIGAEPPGIVDVDPVLRLFGSRRETASSRFADFVAAPATDAAERARYSSAGGDVLGSEEFVDAAIHRFGDGARRPARKDGPSFDPESLMGAVESVFGMPRAEFCGREKNARAVMAKEVLIVTGGDAGATVTQLADFTGLDPSSVTRRCDAARIRLRMDSKFAYATDLVTKQYQANIAESQV